MSVAPPSSVAALGNVNNDTKAQIITANTDTVEFMPNTLIAPAESVHDLHGVQPQGVSNLQVVTRGVPFPAGTIAQPESVTPLGNIEHDDAIKAEIVSEGEAFDIVAPPGSITRFGSIDDGRVRIEPLMTAAIKYAYMLSFAISTGDDPEADSKTDEHTMGGPVKAKPKEAKPVTAKKKFIKPENVPVCEECGAAITEKVQQFSESVYGRPLCMKCQRKEQGIA